jgi:hypothetical protein
MSDALPEICGLCTHTHEARYSRRRMLVRQWDEPDGRHYEIAPLCDWCFRDHPERAVDW